MHPLKFAIATFMEWDRLTILRLTAQLKEATAKIATLSTALAKSEAALSKAQSQIDRVDCDEDL